MRISVFNRAELQGTILRLKAMPRELAKQIRAQTKALGQPQWQSQLGQYGKTEMEQRLLVKSGRVAVSNQNVTLSSGGVGKSFQHGVKPSQLVPGVEFGANRDKVKTYTTRSSKGKSYQVTRHTQRHLPPRRATGYVVYQAAAKFIPRMAALWVQTTVRTLHEAFEGK